MLFNYLKQIGDKSIEKLNVLQLVSKWAARSYASKEFKVDLEPIKIHNLEKQIETHIHITKEQALLYYTQMLHIRRVETAASNLYKSKHIRGFLHLYTGQEAVAVGIKSVMRSDDSIITAYRCHGFALLQGMSLFEMLAELTGRVDGVCRGKGGSMHLYANHFYGGNGIVGAQVPIGCGIALANKYGQRKCVTFACYGDGAANQGQIYEAFNMASLWKLPVVFVCENNEYGMGTSAERHSANPNYYTRGSAMFIPGIWANGMNVLAVREAARSALEHCITGKGPVLIEAFTYRYHGHSMSDPGTSYRSRKEIEEVRKTRDPIAQFTDLILTHKIATKEELKAIEAKIKIEIDAAILKTRASPEPSIAELGYDVYADDVKMPVIRFKVPDQTLTHKRLGAAVNA